MSGPTVAACCAFRYEPEWMLDDWRENVAWADLQIVIDQRDRTDLWSPRAERVELIQDAATRAGADWCLILDVDERLEDRARNEVRRLVRKGPGIRWTFPFCELWTPDSFRVDGLWGRKTRRRLFHLGTPLEARRMANSRIYHLKMIEPANRARRAEVHEAANTWDNKSLGFRYMTDESGLELERVAPGRGYSPPYRPYAFDTTVGRVQAKEKQVD